MREDCPGILKKPLGYGEIDAAIDTLRRLINELLYCRADIIDLQSKVKLQESTLRTLIDRIRTMEKRDA